MSRTYTTVAAAAFACCLFAGTANAVPYFPERDSRSFGHAPAQIGPLPSLFYSFSKFDWQSASLGRAALVDSRVYDSHSAFGPMGGLAGALMSFGSSGDHYRGGLNAIYDLLRLILALLDKYNEHHHGGSNGGDTGAPEAPAQTPLPAPILLLGSGLAVVGLVARRRKQQAAVAA